MRDSASLLQRSFQEAQIGIAMADLDMRLHYVNPAFCNFLGRSADELIGRSQIEFVHPDRRAACGLVARHARASCQCAGGTRPPTWSRDTAQ
jgi:PAS domain S-box-containing protein